MKSVPDYIQHNSIIPTTAKALGEFFNSASGARKNLGLLHGSNFQHGIKYLTILLIRNVCSQNR